MFAVDAIVALILLLLGASFLGMLAHWIIPILLLYAAYRVAKFVIGQWIVRRITQGPRRPQVDYRERPYRGRDQTPPKY